MGSLQIFLDETYVKQPPAEILAVASVGAFKTQWPRYAKELCQLSGLRASRKLEAVHDFVASRNLRGVIAGARLDSLGAASGVRDSFSGMGLIARRDNVWSQVMEYSAAQLLKRVLENGWLIGTVEALYDSKALSPSHRQVAHEAFRRAVAREATRFTRRQKTIRSQVITIAHVGPVAKPARLAQSSSTQWGIWLAHWVAKLPHTYAGPSMPPNVEVYDVAPIVRTVLSKMLLSSPSAR